MKWTRRAALVAYFSLHQPQPTVLASCLIGKSPERSATQRGYHSRFPLFAKPKRGSIVDSYQTVSVNCSKCRSRLFRYKKKNGTKSNLIKCYVERIVEDPENILDQQPTADSGYQCPKCHTQFARASTIKGLPALKLVGGKVRMTKK